MTCKAVAKMLLTALCLLGSVTWATTLYVNGVTGNDTNNNCTSSLTPCKTIGHAMSLAASGYNISVAAGTYPENLTISLSLNIIGSGASTTIIDGGGINTVVYVSSGTKVSLNNLTIRNGLARSGGGIYNQGILTISKSTVTGNSAFARYPGYGGGIINGGTLTITRSTISGNTASCGVMGCAGTGGGIANYGGLTVTNSTISGNTASGHYAYAHGGGIYDGSYKVSINNSTIAGNTASYFGKGGNIYSAGTVVLQNSIVANGIDGNCYGPVGSNGYNLSSDGTCNFTSTGDMNNANPMIGPLQNNGGPTNTMALPSGSPALDAGNPNGCRDGSGNLLKTDQRGQPRPDVEDAGGCDMGAYEHQSD